MKQLIIYIGLAFSVFSACPLLAQGIWAADMAKRTLGTKVWAKVEIFRFGEPREAIRFDWGDGQEEIVGLSFTGIQLSSGLTIDTYSAYHEYEAPGFYELSFIDSFLVAGVANIEDSGSKRLHLKDSLLVLPPSHPHYSNEAPRFFSDPTGNVIYMEDGALKVRFSFFNDDLFLGPEEFRGEIAPFPAEGYSPPAGEESFYMDGFIMVWDRPLAPGIYATCIKVSEFRRWDSPAFDFFMSTAHRAMMVEVSEDMIVSAPAPFLAGALSLYPNPASEEARLQLSGFSPGAAALWVHDAAGRAVHQQDIALTGGFQELAIDVSRWPAGVYFLQLQSPAGQVSKRLVVE